MQTKPKKVPGPDHPITIEPTNQRVVVTFHGQTVAETRTPLILRESTYDPVYYIPREDVDMSLLERTDHATYCPYKGDASYYSIRTGESRAENAVWTYEDPYQHVVAIKDYVAFYPDRVDAIEIS